MAGLHAPLLFIGKAELWQVMKLTVNVKTMRTCFIQTQADSYTYTHIRHRLILSYIFIFFTIARHAAFSEKRVRSDQRRTENTLSANRQSQLESDYVIEFKDGTRVDAIDIISSKTSLFRGNKSTPVEYLKCCRLACLIFEVAYDFVLRIKKSFATFTSTVIEALVTEAPAIGSDSKLYPLWKLQYGHAKDAVFATQDAVTEIMILVKEGAKNHNLRFLVEDVMTSICTTWVSPRTQLLPEYDRYLLQSLKDYIHYCIQFAWYAVTQVPPLKIDYTTTVYSSKSHIVSQAFSLTEQDRSPSRHSHSFEARKIMCYLWPTLLDCDGKVISKGEVILAHQQYNVFEKHFV